MAGGSIEAALRKAINNYMSLSLDAAKDAAHQIQGAIMKEAYDYLARYYANYSPSMYDRQYKLRRSIMPYWKDSSGSNSISITVGVKYSSGALAGAYRSNSRFHQTGDTWRVVEDYSDVSSDYGRPEGSWILNNFLLGIHPPAAQDAESTQSLMEDYFNNVIPGMVNDLFFSAILGAISAG